jgi:hypothetical protein
MKWAILPLAIHGNHLIIVKARTRTGGRMKKIFFFLMVVLGLSSLAYAGPRECERSVNEYATLVESTSGPDEKIGVEHFYSRKLDKCFVVLSYDSTSGVANTIAEVDRKPAEGNMDKLYAAFIWLYQEGELRTCFVWGKIPCSSREEWLDLERRNRPL